MSYGISKENDYGNVFLKKGNYADYFECELYIKDTDYDTLARVFRQFREVILLWDLNGSQTGHEHLLTYGFYQGRPRFVLLHPNDYKVTFRIREFT
jgi:hypothetical protein